MIVRRILIFLRNRAFTRTVIFCSTLIIFGFSYIYLGDSVVRIISLTLFCLLSMIVLFGLGPIIWRFIKVIGTRIGSLINWISIKICKKQKEEVAIIEGLDEFNQLAKQMKVKLNKKQPFKMAAMLD